MNKISPVLRENEFLLTSSDSAYVMSDLSPSQLEKAASIIARGAFSNCGHNFNSIKRVFVDRDIGVHFVELLAKEASKYYPKENLSDVNDGLLAPFLILEEYAAGLKKIE
jgi:acyl-CoA reductase-like NAD-dependent aldehyde dehydrogenase